MTASVYLSNERIAVVTGKATARNIKVRTFDTVELFEGTIINGMVLNDEIIRADLVFLRSRGMLPKKNVRLVIDRSSVLVKFLKIPRMNHNHILDFIENSFSGAANAQNELVYDYSVIERGETKATPDLILATAIEKSLIEEYYSLFSSAGVELNSIDIALNSIIKMQNNFKKFKDKTFLFSFMDAENMFSLLFLNGRYNFSNRFRLISKRGTSDSAVEIGGFLSSMLQFNKTQKRNQEIEFAVFSGLHEDEADICEELTGMLNLKVMPFNTCDYLILDKKVKNREQELLNSFFTVANLIC